jgi:predicted MFS family arabinose efflux permease
MNGMDRMSSFLIFGKKWLPFLLLAPFQFIFGIIYSWGTIANAVHVQGGWSYSLLDLAFSLTLLAILPAVIWAGHALRRINPKTMLGISLCIAIAGDLLIIINNTPTIFIIGCNILTLGISSGLSTAACIALISRLYPKYKGTAGGTLLAIYGMSAIVSAPVFNFLNVNFGWRMALALLIGGYVFISCIAWIFLPKASPQKAHKTKHIPLKRMLKHPQLLWAMLLILAAAPFGSASFASIGDLSDKMGFGAKFIIIAVAMMAIGNGTGRLAFGLLADMRSVRFSRNTVFAVNAAAGLLLLLSIHGAGLIFFTVYPLLTGLAFGGMAGKLPAVAGHVVEQDNAETAFGLLLGTFALASFLGPSLSAIVGMDISLQVLALFSIAAFSVAVILRD